MNLDIPTLQNDVKSPFQDARTVETHTTATEFRNDCLASLAFLVTDKDLSHR